MGRDDVAERELLGNSFGRAITEVLQAMAGLDPVSSDSGSNLSRCPEGWVTGMILLTGLGPDPLNLLISLTMTQDTLATVVSLMTGIPVFNLTEADRSDGLLELANMTAGRAKTALANSGYHLQLTAPWAIQGGDYRMVTKERVVQVVRDFLAEQMELELRIYCI